MNDKQLEKGTELKAKIDFLKDEHKSWTDSTQFYSVVIKISQENSGYLTVSTDYVNFKVLRTMTLMAIEEELTKLKHEYEQL